MQANRSTRIRHVQLQRDFGLRVALALCVSVTGGAFTISAKASDSKKVEGVSTIKKGTLVLDLTQGDDDGGVAGTNCDDCDGVAGSACNPGFVECDQGGTCICVFEDQAFACSAGNPCPTGTVCCANCGGATGSCMVPSTGCLTTVDCNDNNACTIDECTDFSCVFTPVICTPPDLCHTPSCDAVAGCQFPLKDCDDGIACTIDGCDMATGACTHSSNCDCQFDSDCNDGDSCPNDTCDETTGTCVFNTPPCSACQTPSDCNDNSNCTTDLCVNGFCENPLTCVPVDPSCFSPACINDACNIVPINCDDQDSCTADSCTDGVGCTHSPIAGCCVDVVDCDDGVACSVDSCVAGICTYDTSACSCAVDTDCNDNDPCTTDTCIAGACNFADSGTCVGACCISVPPGCIEVTEFDCGGQGVYLGDNTTCADTCCGDDECDDGNVCTSDLCDNHTCSHAPAVGCCNADTDCEDQDACTRNHCENNACVFPPYPGCCASDLDCDDGDLCNGTQVCASNNCCTGHGGLGCSDAGCQAVVCAVDAFCCNTAWDSVCAGEANDLCDICVPEHDCCVNNGGVGCSDATCETAVCGQDPFCCDTTWDSICAGQAIALCAVCDVDTSDTPTVCGGGTPLDCGDDAPCTADSCDPVNGCVHTPDNGECDDGIECTIDTCLAGGLVCSHVSDPTVCDDNNPCTDELCCGVLNPGPPVCEGILGCHHVPAGGPAGVIDCDDGNACTVGDFCSQGQCDPGAEALDCDDNNPCTDDSCDPASGCVNTNNDANQCSDNDACTTVDACEGGQCVGSDAPDCDDGIACTVDTCDVNDGCLNTPDNAACDDGNDCTTDICDVATGCVNPCTDTIPPQANCGDTDIQISCEEAVPDYNPTFQDNCDDDLEIDSTSSELPGNCPQERTIRQVVRATDDCDNSATCVRIINVVDETAPTVDCPPEEITVECDQPQPPFEPVFSDNCDTDLLVQIISGIAPGDCPQEFAISRSATATDDCGNSTSCGQVVHIVDTTPPVVSNCPPAEVTYECDQPFPGFEPTFVDNCDTELTPTGDCIVIAGDCPQEQDIQCGQAAQDDCGNISGCATTFHKVDTTPPVVTCRPVVTVTCPGPNGIPVNQVFIPDGTAVDNCDTDTPVTDDRRTTGFYPPTCDGPGTLITFTSVDDCGNVGTCETRVRVIGGMCCPTITDTDLKLMVTDLDLRQDTNGPVTTKARFDIWNSNEVRFSGTEKCITCWNETLISEYVAISNHFLLENLQTDKGKARIQNEGSDVCPDSVDSPLLGVAIKEHTFLGSPHVEMRSAITLPGAGEQAATIRYDQITVPEEGNHPTGAARSGSLTIVPTPITNVQPMGPVPNNGTTLLGDDFVAPNRASTTYKGSLVAFPVIEVKWDRHGQLIQDTFIQILNDNPGEVNVQFYQVNGDAPLDAVIDSNNNEVIERAHPGWNWSDYQITLTGDETCYFSVATGQPKGVSPIFVLDAGNPNGRPDLDPSNPGGRLIRGFLAAWAVNDDQHEIRWNHLKGHATVVRYDHATAWDYNPWNFRVVSGVAEGSESDGTAGQLKLNGIEYDLAPETLIFDFYAAGATALTNSAVDWEEED